MTQSFCFLSAQIKQNAPLGTKDEPGPNPLQIAAGIGDLEKVEEL